MPIRYTRLGTSCIYLLGGVSQSACFAAMQAIDLRFHELNGYQQLANLLLCALTLGLSIVCAVMLIMNLMHFAGVFHDDAAVKAKLAR